MRIDVPGAIDAFLKTVEPEYSGGDEISFSLTVGQLAEMLADGDATFEDHAGRLPCADALGYLVEATGSAERTFDIRGRATRGGDEVAFHDFAIPEELQSMRADIHE